MSEPMTADRYLELGFRALHREEFAIAVDQFEAAIAIAPGQADAHAYLSGALLAMNQPLEAQDAVRRALALDPDGFGPRQKAGELALRLGDPVGAQDHFLAALRAARPGTSEEIAAKAALIRARQQVRVAIDHRASLPRLPVGLGTLRAIGRARRRPRRAEPT